ncbi:hypothetical protein ACFQL8_17135 [Streptomyces goshikiensis]|uniref:hypothetical protein n=1 Tax=Streptomyces goshikiensis TaxID=1942 RepID=UPI001679CF15|nr:hypothetical protein [Streptomyces goshikiensis]GHD56022.1 hypothetical protein GCM10010336_00880 [Streptomyces goshikiensis]
MSEYLTAERGWVAISRHPKFGTDVDMVKWWELDEDGIKPLIKEPDGLMVEPGPHTRDVVRATPKAAFLLAAGYELEALVERAVTDREFELIEQVRGLLKRAWTDGE